MKASLRGKVVVVTGASSGLGRQTAIAFARRGCTVVLAARRADALEETARMCRDAGGSAISVVTDVTKEEAVDALAERALSEAGGIDIWVNNAGVTLFGALDAAPFEEHRRVIETNLYGPMLSARAILPIFRRQRHGVLINVGSILGKLGQPFVPSYVISKFALRGLSEALRMELADQPDVHVCSILPYAVDTPHFQSGANYVGRVVRAMPPMQSPEKVARAIVRLAERPRREVHMPRLMLLGVAARFLMPRTSERLLLHGLDRWHFSNVPQLPSQGTLFTSSEEKPSVHGDRPPQIGTPGILAWLTGEFFRIKAQGARRLAQRWRARARTSLAKPRLKLLSDAQRAVP